MRIWPALNFAFGTAHSHGAMLFFIFYFVATQLHALHVAVRVISARTEGHLLRGLAFSVSWTEHSIIGARERAAKSELANLRLC